MNKKKVKEIVDEVMEVAAEEIPTLNEVVVEETAPVAEIIEPVQPEIEDDVLVEDRPPVEAPKFAIGDEVKLIPGAKYVNGVVVPEGIIKSKLFVRKVKDNAYVLGLQTYGRLLGEVDGEYVVAYSAPVEMTAKIKPYLVFITDETVDVKSKPVVDSKTLKVLDKDSVFTVVDEKDGWAHLKIGGWIPLEKTFRP